MTAWGAVLLVGLASTAEPPCSVEGTVLDAASAEPIPRVSVRPVATATRGRALTDDKGRFSVNIDCKSKSLLQLSRADYETKRVGVEPGDDVSVALDARRVTRIDDVVVDAPALAERDTRAVARLDSDALERTLGRNLADSVAEVPGVSVLRSGATAKPVIRGQFGRRVVILFDGVRHEAQKWGLDHGPEIDPFAAGEMQVIKGAAGSRYGPDAIGGVLLVSPHLHIEDPGVAARVDTVYNSNGRRGTIAARAAGRLASIERMSARLEANVSKGAGLVAPRYALDNTGSTQWNAAAAVAYATDVLTAELSFRHHDLVAGICSCVRNETRADLLAQIAADLPINVESFGSRYSVIRPFQDVSHDTAIARARWASPLGELVVTYAFQINRRKEFDTTRKAVTNPTFDFKLRTHSVDVVLSHDPFALSDEWSVEGEWGLAASFQENVFRGVELIPNYRGASGGLFVVERLVGPRLELQAGLRGDFMTRRAFLDDNAYEKHLDQGQIEDNECEFDGDVARCSSAFNALSVSVGGIYALTDELDVRVDLSSASRFPSIDEQYINGSAPSFPVFALGVPNIGKETTWNGSLTVNFASSWLAAEASLFASYIDNYIDLAPVLNPDGSLGVDVGIRGASPRFVHRAVNAVFYGADGGFTTRLGDFDLQGKLSMVRARDVENDRFFIFVPSDRFRLAATYHPPDASVFTDSFITAHGQFVTRQTRFDINTDFAPPPDAYAVFGFAAGSTVPFDSYALSMSLEVNNVLDTQYRDYTSLLRYFADEPGIDVILRVGAEL